MPSASLVSSKAQQPENAGKDAVNNGSIMADSPNEAPLWQAVQIVEKKVRNLEKRKGKLDGYRADKDKGKTLNADQEAAIGKYEVVLQSLDVVRELSNQFKGLHNDDVKNRKKQIKKDLQEKSKGETDKIALTLEIQDILRSIGSPKAKTDFLAGENGAVKLTKEQIASLEEFARVVRPSRRQHESEDEFAKVLQESAEHFMSVIEGKGKKVQGCKSTYKDLKDLLDKIKATGYFNGKSLKEEKTADSSEGSHDSVDGASVSKPKEEGSRKSKNVENGKQEKRHRHRKGSKDEKVQNNFDPEPEKKPVEDAQHYQAQVVSKEATSPPKPTEDQVANGILSQPPQYGNGHPAAASDNAQFNFLQDSQIDMESPHMDPAVVVVQHTAPHPPHHHLTNHLPVTSAGPANGGPVPVTTHQQMMAQPPQQPSIQTAFSNHQIILATPPTTLAAMQQAHAAYAFQHQQQLQHQAVNQPPEQAPNQHPVANPPQEVPSPQERPLEETSTAQPKQQKSQDEEQMPKAPKKRPEPAPAKPTGCAAIAAAGFHRQEAAQQKVQPDTMVSIDDWKNEDANDQQQSGGDGFHQGGPRRGGGRYNGDNRGRGRGGHRGRGGNGGGRGNKDGGNRGRGGKREFRGGRGGAERGGTRGGRGANGFHHEQKVN